jgi:hypothetical protein
MINSQNIDALHKVYPNIVRTVGNTAYDADGKEVQYDLAVVQAYIDANAYVSKRQSEYPAIGDQLDALWKGGDAAAEMLAKVQAVKAKYPKGATE